MVFDSRSRLVLLLAWIVVFASCTSAVARAASPDPVKAHWVGAWASSRYLSDAVEFPAEALTDVAITMRLTELPAGQTGHPGSRTTTFLLGGDRLSDADLPAAERVVRWHQLAGVDVLAPGAAAIVVLGDSITDGHGSTTDGNDRWTDFLARRLQAHGRTRHLSVLNQGIGGNRLLKDGIGANALARFRCSRRDGPRRRPRSPLNPPAARLSGGPIGPLRTS